MLNYSTPYYFFFKKKRTIKEFSKLKMIFLFQLKDNIIEDQILNISLIKDDNYFFSHD